MEQKTNSEMEKKLSNEYDVGGEKMTGHDILNYFKENFVHNNEMDEEDNAENKCNDIDIYEKEEEEEEEEGARENNIPKEDEEFHKRIDPIVGYGKYMPKTDSVKKNKSNSMLSKVQDNFNKLAKAANSNYRANLTSKSKVPECTFDKTEAANKCGGFF